MATTFHTERLDFCPACGGPWRNGQEGEAAIVCANCGQPPTVKTAPSANDMQVGGSHYGGDYQHWDLVADLGMNYYQGNASKYITRAYKKNGRQDLEKAVHYMQKAIELQRQGRLDEPDDDADFDIILRFMTANDLTLGQGKIIWKIYHGEWYSAIDLTRALIAKVTDEDAHPKIVTKGMLRGTREG